VHRGGCSVHEEDSSGLVCRRRQRIARCGGTGKSKELMWLCEIAGSNNVIDTLHCGSDTASTLTTRGTIRLPRRVMDLHQDLRYLGSAALTSTSSPHGPYDIRLRDVPAHGRRTRTPAYCAWAARRATPSLCDGVATGNLQVLARPSINGHQPSVRLSFFFLPTLLYPHDTPSRLSSTTSLSLSTFRITHADRLSVPETLRITRLELTSSLCRSSAATTDA
jgi:hypothetical protein